MTLNTMAAHRAGIVISFTLGAVTLMSGDCSFQHQRQNYVIIKKCEYKL